VDRRLKRIGHEGISRNSPCRHAGDKPIDHVKNPVHVLSPRRDGDQYDSVDFRETKIGPSEIQNENPLKTNNKPYKNNKTTESRT